MTNELLQIGFDDDGLPLWVAREYEGDLDRKARESRVHAAFTTARDVVRHAANNGDSDDLLRVFRAELLDFICVSLSYGVMPTGFAEAIRAGGVECGIDADEVARLVDEVDTACQVYERAHGVVRGGAWLFDAA